MMEGEGGEEMQIPKFLSDHVESMSKEEWEAFKALSGLMESLKLDRQFRSELSQALQQRGALEVRVSCRSKATERALRMLEVGAPECNASANRALKNMATRLLLLAIEHSGENDGKGEKS